jgi:hypothetical protein
MAKRREITAVVFVRKDWYDDTLRLLIGKPKSTSANDTHILIGELRDSTDDPHGIWFRDVPSPHVRDDGVVKMEFMVPWSVVLGVGLVDESGAQTIGFQPGAFTLLKQE